MQNLKCKWIFLIDEGYFKPDIIEDNVFYSAYDLMSTSLQVANPFMRVNCKTIKTAVNQSEKMMSSIDHNNVPDSA